MNPKPLRHVDLYSDAGRLEAIYRDLAAPAGVAVVCHPHPLHGGTLHNKVVFRASKGLESSNIATLRFNFRGAGSSHGRHAEGEGELRDVEAAITWMQKKHPGIPLMVGGFSFGAWVSSRVGCDRPDVEALFLLGAPINKYDLTYLGTCRKPKLFIHGTRDEFGDIDRLSNLVTKWPNSEMVIVDGADHFFNRKLEVVEETMRQWALEVIAER